MTSMRLLLALLLCSGVAHARSEGRSLGYQRDHVWPTTVRFLVVDEKAKVIDKDGDAGYVLFELKSENKSYRGSLEIITVQADGRPNIKFAINIVDGALWREAGMLQRLEQKLRNELGTPPPPPKKPKEPAPKDGDKDKDKDATKDGGNKDAKQPKREESTTP
jgi:hypothetical protein